MPPLAMGDGFTLSVGSIASESLNAIIETVAVKHEVLHIFSTFHASSII
jgi:hypothetical protein